jgi:hypothetical protein
MRPTLLTVRSKDLVRAEQFYGLLGVVFARHTHGGPEHLCAESDGMVFEIYPLPTSPTRLGFHVDDVPHVLRELEAMGVEVVQRPRASAWGLRAIVRDDDGHDVELVQSASAEPDASMSR